MKSILIAMLATTLWAQDATKNNTDWVASSLRAMESIKVGMTRGQLLTVFSTEGGISWRQHRTYVFKDCPYMKVDVDFESAGNPDHFGESLGDKIVKISRPYLQWSILD